MENLVIKPTKASPYIFFDAKNNYLEIKGKSYPANSEDFFKPVFSWLENFLGQSENSRVTVNIELVYFNSSTSMMLAFLFDQLEEAVKKGKEIGVNWCYEEYDEDSLESGEDYQEEFPILKFNFVEKDIVL